MSIVNTKYTTLCIEPDLELVLEDTSNIDLQKLDYFIKKFKSGEKQLNIHVGEYLEFDLTFKMVVIGSGYRITNGYFVTPVSKMEHIIKINQDPETIINLLEKLHHFLAHSD